MKKTEVAVTVFQGACNCTQAVVTVYGPELGLDKETGLRLARGFGGGIGLQGLVCGAVSGAVMILGLKCGAATEDAAESNKKAYVLANRFMKEFSERNGSIFCRELLGWDISTLEGLKAARDQDLFNKTCPKYIRDAGELIEQLA